jgi:hypothetical protein
MDGKAWPNTHQDKRWWKMDPPQIVRAGRGPATRALGVVQPPRRLHRPGVDGRDTSIHMTESRDGERELGWIRGLS